MPLANDKRRIAIDRHPKDRPAQRGGEGTKVGSGRGQPESRHGEPRGE